MLGVDGIGYLAFSLHLVVVVGRLDHVAPDDECLVAEYLSQKVDVLGGIGGAEVLAIVEYGVASFGIRFAQLALHDFGYFLVERIALRHRADINL